MSSCAALALRGPLASPLRAEVRVDGAAVFEELLAEVLPAAYGVALRMTGNRLDAEDLVQEAALRAFRGFAGFQPGTNFRAWFFRILMNAFHAGRRRRTPEQSLSGLEDACELYLYAQAMEAGMLGRGDDPACRALAAIAAEDVGRALERLPEEFRAVCALYLIEDFSYREIADVLQLPLGTVRSRLHRGRRMLQKLLWKLAQDQGLVPAEQAPAEGR